MTRPDRRSYAPTRRSHQRPRRKRPTLQIFWDFISGCCCIDGRDGGDTLGHSSDRPRSRARRGGGPPPPTPASSPRGPGPPPRRPRRPSEYEMDEQRAMRRAFDQDRPGEEPSHQQQRKTSAPRDFERPRGSKRDDRHQHLSRPVITDSPTARIVSQDSEPELNPPDVPPKSPPPLHTSTSPSRTIPQQQEDFIALEVEERAQQHKHLAKLREAQRKRREQEGEAPVNANEGASMYNEAPTSPRDDEFFFIDQEESPDVLQASSVGMHYYHGQNERDQRHFDDGDMGMRGIVVEGEAATPSPAPRQQQTPSSSPDPMFGIPEQEQEQGAEKTFALRRRLEAARQAVLTDSVRAFAAGETTSAGQPVEPLKAISGNARKFPASKVTPRPISEYVESAAVSVGSLEEMRELRNRSR